MAFPVVEQVIENSTNTAGTSHTINLPTASKGQLLLIILDKGSTAATVNAHTELTELLDENLANGLYIAYRLMDGAEPASYTLTTSASTRTASLAYRISNAGAGGTVAPEIGTTGTGTSATPDPPASATPGSTKDYLFIAFYGAAGEEADDDTWSDTPPTNYTPSPPRQKACGIAGTNLGGLIAAAERQLTTGSAENPGTFAKDVSAAWRSQTVMIHPAIVIPNAVKSNPAYNPVQESTPTESILVVADKSPYPLGLKTTAHDLLQKSTSTASIFVVADVEAENPAIIPRLVKAFSLEEKEMRPYSILPSVEEEVPPVVVVSEDIPQVVTSGMYWQ